MPQARERERESHKSLHTVSRNVPVGIWGFGEQRVGRERERRVRASGTGRIAKRRARERGEKERNPACNFSDVGKRKEMAYAEGEDGLIIYTERPTGASAIINGPRVRAPWYDASFLRGFMWLLSLQSLQGK